MDLRQLNYFLAVARLRSITQASRELNVAQPSLSKSIRLLEEELGTALVSRLPRGVELTPAGASLLRHAEAVRLQISEARAELSALARGDSGAVAIGAGPAWQQRHLPQALAAVARERPNIRVSVAGGFDEALLRSLRRGEFDFVVAEVPWAADAGDLSIEVLTQSALCVCARAGHPLAGSSGIGFCDLLAFPWVMPVKATRARQRLEALFMAQNLSPPEPVIESGSMTFMLAAVSCSDALTYTTAMTLRAPEASALVALDAPVLASEREAGIIRRRTSRSSPTVDAVLSALRKVSCGDPFN